MDNMIFSKNVRELCKKNNITIQQMIADCELQKAFFYDIEKRGTKPSIEKIERIAVYFKVSIDWLIGRI